MAETGCAYCGEPDTRIDPFGGEACCDGCFNLLIGGEYDDPPFRCGTCTPDEVDEAQR